MRRDVLHLRSFLLTGLVVAAVLTSAVQVPAGEIRSERGFAIVPPGVTLTFPKKNRDLVGLGSYIVNAQGGCNDCHTCPSYTPGHNPFPPTKGDGQINATNYLAGGVSFGPVTSANITPDLDTGRPAGLTLEEFIELIRTGHDPDSPPGSVLAVMPWPIYRNMQDKDLEAIYAYLSAIPHAEPGTCVRAGQ